MGRYAVGLIDKIRTIFWWYGDNEPCGTVFYNLISIPQYSCNLHDQTETGGRGWGSKRTSSDWQEPDS